MRRALRTACWHVTTPAGAGRDQPGPAGTGRGWPGLAGATRHDPAELGLNGWALSGDWTTEEQATTLNTANGRIACRFHARDLHLVMGPAAAGNSVRFHVLVDGHQGLRPTRSPSANRRSSGTNPPSITVVTGATQAAKWKDRSGYRGGSGLRGGSGASQCHMSNVNGLARPGGSPSKRRYSFDSR